jgi:hypothetical protein
MSSWYRPGVLNVIRDVFDTVECIESVSSTSVS